MATLVAKAGLPLSSRPASQVILERVALAIKVNCHMGVERWLID